MIRIPRAPLWLAAILVGSTLLQAEDVKLREQAVHLMAIANAVSLPGALKNYSQVVTFRIYEPDAAEKDGTFTRISAGAAGYREEFTFGEYHNIIVRSGDRISSTAHVAMPLDLRKLYQELPIRLGLFDHEDVIRSIEDSNVLGRAAKCINFDTQFGNTVQNNQLCMDTQTGGLLRFQVGDLTYENSNFFSVGNLWEPGHIRRYLRGQLQLEVEQHMELIQGPMDPNVFASPSGKWTELYPCKNPRRAIGISTPMPPAGNAGTDIVDVLVHGWIWNDGTVKNPEVESSPRGDLNAEALQMVSTWKFLPLMCNDKVATTEGDFVVHFQGR